MWGSLEGGFRFGQIRRQFHPSASVLGHIVVIYTHPFGGPGPSDGRPFRRKSLCINHL